MTALPFRYYVTYTANAPNGFVRGAIDIERDATVSDFAQVREMADLILELRPQLSDIVITSWRRYEDPASDAPQPDDNAQQERS